MVTATLKNWSVDFIGISSLVLVDKNFRIKGMCFGDERKRFRDGDFIYTSLVCGYDFETGIVSTMNSTYKLENPADHEELNELKELMA